MVGIDMCRKDCTCSKCDANVVGDEHQVSFQCENYDIVMMQNKYIPNYYKSRSTQINFVNVN